MAYFIWFGGASYSLTKLCDQMSLPVRLSSAKNCLSVAAAKRRLPTRSGVACGPEPRLKFIVTSEAGKRYSQIVLPDAGSSAMTTSSSFQVLRTPVGGRYIV